ncbi:hypothetical protein, partial [Novosphingobium sp. 9U]
MGQCAAWCESVSSWRGAAVAADQSQV